MTTRLRGRSVARALGLAVLCLALAGLAPGPLDSRILFARGSPVPPAVQQFAWRVIEARCNYQAYERDRRSFWAADARAVTTEGGIVYSIHVLSEVTWRNREPPAVIDMTIRDDGQLRLTAIRSSFVSCSL